MGAQHRGNGQGVTMDAATYVSKPKDWIQTFTGKQFWPTEPRAQDVDIIDIAHALSMKCRYNGHCHTFYSVAEHSVIVSHFVPRELALWGLLHDASEAYLVDVPRPIKPFLTNFKELEGRVMVAICEHFGLPIAEPPEVKRIDMAVLGDEMTQLMGPPPADWKLPEPALGVQIHAFNPEAAKMLFLERFYFLTGRLTVAGHA